MEESKYFKQTERPNNERLRKPEMRGTWVECLELNQDGLQFVSPMGIHCIVRVGDETHVFSDDRCREVTKKGAEAGLRLTYVRSRGTVRCGVRAADIMLHDNRGLGIAVTLDVSVDEPKDFFDSVARGKCKFTDYELASFIRRNMKRALKEGFRGRTSSELTSMSVSDLQDEIRALLNDMTLSSLPKNGLSIMDVHVESTRLL